MALDCATMAQIARSSSLATQLSPRAGAAIALIKDGATCVLTLGTGVDARTPVEIGSVTKVFTGLLLAQAVLRGEIALDSRVDEVLFNETWPGDAAITAELLATHRSGLPRFRSSSSSAASSSATSSRASSRNACLYWSVIVR